MDPTQTTQVIDVLVISTAVVTLVQLSKWAGLRDNWGPLAVLLFSLGGVALWGYSEGQPFAGRMIWQYFAGWINVALAAAGIFGFTRASGEAVSRMKPPPTGGAGGDRTV